MRILIVSNYYYPETVGAAIWVTQLARELTRQNHQVTVLTSFPSYPEGTVFASYRGNIHRRQCVDDVEIIRTLTYATPSKAFWPRVASFGTFCVSSMIGGLAMLPKPDVIYAILPPLPLGASAGILSLTAHAPMVVNIQDIYPDIAVDSGYLRNRSAIRFFQRMERWIYAKSAGIVVISEGFRQRLLGKKVPPAKLSVVPNWADPDSIRPGPRDNSFRRELGVINEFLIVYSGGLTHNSHLEPVLEAARELIHEPFRFAIVGDGVRKESLERMAADLALTNVQFLPFQPLDRYPEVLRAADLTLVTLHSSATYASVPSKIYKQMAAGRAILALTNGPNELTNLIRDAACGYCVPSGGVRELVQAFRFCAEVPEQLGQLGANGRAYLERECSMDVCVKRIERILVSAVGHRKASSCVGASA